MKRLSLSTRQKTELTRQSKKESPHQAACRAILLLDEGVGPTEISNQLNVSRAAVYNWWRIFEAQGVQGLLLRTQPGRGDRVDSTLAERIVELTQEALSKGEKPSAADIANMVGVSLPTVYRHWKKTNPHSQSSPTPLEKKKTGSTIPNPTMSDVAKAAGTSKSTVSKVVNNARGVSPETRQRVQKALDELQYRRHPYVSALMGNLRGNRIHRIQATLAWLYAGDYSPHEVANQPYGISHLYLAASEHAHKLGFDLVPFRLNAPDVPMKRFLRILVARGIDGLIFGNPDPGDYSPAFDEFPSVAFANFPWGEGNRVGDDMRSTVMRVLKNMWERGYRRTGLIHDERLSALTNYQVCSCVDFVGSRVLQHKPIPSLSLGNEVEYLRQTYQKENYREKQPWAQMFDHAQWLEEVDWKPIFAEHIDGNMPEQTKETILRTKILDLWRKKFSIDSIITFFSDTSEYLKNAGYRIPEDVALVHLNWNEDVAHWTGIRRDFELKAKVAVETLAAEIAKDRRYVTPVHSRHLVQPLWVEGETLPKRRVTKKSLTWPTGFLQHLDPLQVYEPHEPAVAASSR